MRCWRRRGESQHTENLRLLPLRASGLPSAKCLER